MSADELIGLIRNAGLDLSAAVTLRVRLISSVGFTVAGTGLHSWLQYRCGHNCIQRSLPGTVGSHRFACGFLG